MNDAIPGPEALRLQADRLQTLNEISRVVSATLDLRTLYDTIYEQVGRVMDTTQFFIALHRPERNLLEISYYREEGRIYPSEEFPYGNNVTSLVIERRTPLLFHTADDYVDFVKANGLPEASIGRDLSEAIIFVPLNTGSRTLGAMTVQSMRQHAYTQDDVETLSVIASQAAIAIENARLYEASQDSVRQMRTLLHVAHMVNGSLDLQMVLDSILVGIREAIPYHVAAVLLPDYSKGHLDIVGAIGPPASEERREELRQVMKIPFGEGITGKVFETGEPLLVPDVREFEGFVAHGVAEVLSEMAIPLKQAERVIGVLDVERKEANAFSQDDLELLRVFASQAAIAIENARLFNEQQRRVFELQTIQSIVQQLTPLHDIPSIVALINQELKRLIEYHSCRLFMLDPADQTLLPLNDSDVQGRRLVVKVGEGITGWIALHNTSVVIPNALEDSRASHIADTPRREESMIGAPLVYEGKVQGVITLSKLGVNQFDENDLRLLEIIAGQTAIAFDRARLYEELRTEAVTDPMTGLYNRRYLFERFKEEQARAARDPHVLAAIILDIDKFKRVNDRYGHAAGDVVLQELAAVIRQVVRVEDIVARYGGEEFCILLPEIPLDDAEQVAERLRSRIEEHDLPEAAGVRRVTASVGMALYSPGDRETDLFTRADLAMYAVKHRGGNLVCVAEGETFRFM